MKLLDTVKRLFVKKIDFSNSTREERLREFHRVHGTHKKKKRRRQ